MRWMMKRRRPRGDRGATAVLFAILVSAVLLGVGAVAADVSSWTVERTQTQNGADAGALATAESCARGACDLTVANSKYSTTNSNQTLTNGEAVMSGYPCGSAPNSSVALPACAASQPADCPANRAGTNWVTVRTMTSSSVSPIFGKALDSTDNGKTVVSCSQASWGPASSCGNCAALTISACEWLENTNGGTSFAHNPPLPPSFLDTIAARKAAGINFTAADDPNNENFPDDPPGATIAGSETVLMTHSVSANNPCAAGHSGWDAPGLFGWLSGSNCSVNIVNGEYSGAPGNSPADCNTIFNSSRDNQTPIYLPVYSGIDQATGKYVLYGFAAFVVTGWDINQGNVFSPKKAPSVISVADGTPNGDANYCGKTFTGSPSDVCIYGYFTHALLPLSALPGGGGGTTELGADAVRMSG